MNHLVVDNGGGYIKYGIGQRQGILPNTVAMSKKGLSVLVGDQTEFATSNHAELLYSRPIERGYLTDSETQERIWEYIFGEEGLNLLHGTSELPELVLTRPPFAPADSRKIEDELVFERFEFNKRITKNPATLSVQANFGQDTARSICLVVDLGYSFSTITPVFGGVAYERGIRRLDIGGKLLTNLLKEIVSYKHFNVFDETFVIEDVRRKTSFVSLDFFEDLKACSNRQKRQVFHIMLAKSFPLSKSFLVRYVLPDYQTVKRGHVLKQDETELSKLEGTQILPLTSERFVVPEVYFNPGDIGLNEAGLPEAIEQSILACPEECRRLLSQNILLTGGNSTIPGLHRRLQQELEATGNVTLTRVDPIKTPLLGGLSIENFSSNHVNLMTKARYEEEGLRASR